MASKFVSLIDSQGRSLLVRADAVVAISAYTGAAGATWACVMTKTNAYYVKHTPGTVLNWVEAKL